MSHYRVEVDVDDDKARLLRAGAPSMNEVVDAIADMLEERGFTVADYDVTVHGPPELRIGVVMK